MSETVTTLVRRCDRIAAGFKVVVERSRPDASWLSDSGRVALAGLGLAEGPARFAEHLWRNMGMDARTLPASSFLEPTPIARQDETLVVFSQRLSPNARLLLSRQHEFKKSLLVTTLDDGSCPILGRWREQGGAVYVLPPDEPEDKLLIRVQGPAWSILGVLCLTEDLSKRRGFQQHWKIDVVDLERRYRDAYQAGVELGEAHADRFLAQPMVMLTVGHRLGLAHGLRWKWLEAFWLGVAPLLDVLAFVHGPFQASFNEPSVFLFLRSEEPTHVELGERLRQILPAEHLVLELTSKLASALAVLEYDAVLNGMICGALKGSERALEKWPGRDCDGPLYSVAEPF